MKILTAAALCVLSSFASAQWNVTVLHPDGANDSRANAVHDGIQAGRVLSEQMFRASLWTGSPESWFDLHPPPPFVYQVSEARDIHAGETVGFAEFYDDSGFVVRKDALLWTRKLRHGSSTGPISLTPDGSRFSSAEGIDDGVQAGWATLGGVRRAGLWTGTADSFIDLHPQGWSGSEAHGVHNGQQVGFVGDQDAFTHAALWTGTPESFVDLDPDGQMSAALAVHDGQQAGYAGISAAVWTGTPESRIDLNPQGANNSQALDVYDGVQVGFARMLDDRQEHAGLWRGTRESWEDLHITLPGEPGTWRNSFARGVWNDGQTLYIVGYALQESPLIFKAVLWSRPLCPADIDGDGDSDADDFFAYLDRFAADDSRADLDGDGDIDSDDFFRYLDHFAAGCD